VVAGEVEIRTDGEVVEVARPGSLVGELALIEEGPRSTSVVALTEIVVVPIDRERFLFLVQQTPFFALEVMKILAERLRRRNRRFSDHRTAPTDV
jgi:CRP/FNR family cyclic AMP-dependent transcriptional regulator